MWFRPRVTGFLLTFTAFFAASAAPVDRYALVLDTDPLQTRPHAGFSLQTEWRQQSILSAQASVRTQLNSSHIAVTGAVQNVLNAVFVQATPEQVVSLGTMPGVIAVVKLGVRHLHLDKAAGLVNAPAAWNALGGIPNAGLGLRIAIIDTGIDQNHPAFLDHSLPAVPHVCSQGFDCGSYTNNKVIVARSYVKSIAAGSPGNPAADSRPDDFTPLDHVGHGTAVASVAAGNTNTAPNGETITGMAPKAYLGSYKVYGSVGINDGAPDDVLIQAIEDAMNDGMDIANLSSGGYQFTGPLDTGAVCGNASGVPCDLVAYAYQNAAKAGMVIVVSAGNEGDTGRFQPTLATVNSPASAPDVIAVAASTNAHSIAPGIFVSGPAVPVQLQAIAAAYGDGPFPTAPLTAHLKDAESIGDPLACTALPGGSLAGTFAIVTRGTCNFSVKVINAQSAGAAGVILVLANASDSFISPSGLASTTIPTVLIGQADGQTLRGYAATTPQATLTLDPNFTVSQPAQADIITSFSSRGPALISGVVKPDLTAVGQDIFMAAERTDPTGDVYDPTGYTSASGTSFSSPMTAGAAALVKQAHPNYSASQVKSALVNASNAAALTDGGIAATVTASGGGRLDMAAALASTVTISPQSVFFGVLAQGSTVQPTAFQLTNTGAVPLNLVLTGTPQVKLDRTSLSLAPGASGSLNVSLPGSAPSAGSYQGQIQITGAPTSLHIPYAYIVSDKTAYNLVPLAGDQNVGVVGQTIPDGILAIQITDRFGAPVANLPVRFAARNGGSISQADAATNQYGIATASATLGRTAGLYTFTATAGTLSYTFQDDAIGRPTIATGGVVNAASSQLGAGIAPGSYISLYGTGLSASTAVAGTSALPLSLDGVSVSFDVPSAGISVPGLLYFVSPGQVNVQVPWELAGQSSVQMKVSMGQVSGTVATVPLAVYSPAVFQYGASLAAALDENSVVVGTGNAVRRGHIVSLYANGLGPVSNQPASGKPAPSSPLAILQSLPVITIGGVPAQVQFGGLAPGFTGLYQINVTVPLSAPTGLQPLILTEGGVSATAVNLNIQ